MLLNGKKVSYPGSERVIEDIRFKPGMKNTYANKLPRAGLGLHWTGGLGSFATLMNVLKDRECSITFAVPADGKIYQAADMMTRVAHIGKWNGSAKYGGLMGVETSGRGYASKEDFEAAAQLDPTLRARTELDWSTKADLYTDTIAGRPVNMTAFTPEQIVSLAWLSDACAAIVGYPRVIPFVEATKTLLDQPTPLGDRTLGDIAVTFNTKLYVPSFARDARPAGIYKEWRGTIGHMHVHETKHDPGTQIFYRLWANGWNPAGKTLAI